MITDVADFFEDGCGRCERFASPDCSARLWQAGLAQLREICLEAGLEETAKWGHPCYMHAGRNIAILGAFRGDFRITFFNPALLRDADGVMTCQGSNTRHPDMISFSDDEQVHALRRVILTYLQEAMGYAEAGIKPPKEERSLDMPEELIAALEADPELDEAFSRLTPGRQKSYLFNLSTAKKAETRIARIEKFRSHILAGKGAQER